MYLLLQLTRPGYISYLKSFGPNAPMTNLDLSDSLRIILVDPRDWEFLGFGVHLAPRYVRRFYA